MSWLFGKKKEVKKQPSSKDALNNINDQLENIDAREKLLVKKLVLLTQEAIRLKNSKNTRGAVLALKKRNMMEKELNKLGGMKLMVEQEKIQVEASINNVDIFKALKQGNSIIKSSKHEANLEGFQDLRDEIEEQQEHANEMNEFFIGVAKEGEDEVLEELEKLETENVKKELEAAKVPTSIIRSKRKIVSKKTKIENDRLLEQLMA